MRGAITASLLVALLAAAPAHARTPVTLGKGPGGLLALDAAGGAAYAVVGQPDGAKPMALVRSTGGGAPTTLGTFGVFKARDPDVVAWPGGAAVSWARVITGGMEYSLAALDAGDRLGEPVVVASGTGPPRLTFAQEDPVITRSDALGNVAVGDDTLTSDGLEHRHNPLDVATVDDEPIVLDLAQSAEATTLSVIGRKVPKRPVVHIKQRLDLEGSIVVDANRIYVAFLRRAVAYVATAKRHPDAKWTVKRLPGPGGGEGPPAIARTGGYTWVAYGQGARRRDVYLARIGAKKTRLTHLTNHPDDDTRPLIAPAGNGRVFVGWTRERRGAKSGTALLLKTG